MSISASDETRSPWAAARLLLLVLAVTVGVLAPSSPAQAAAPVTVSLVFNDGLSTQYRNAAPALASRGVNGTFYVASNWVKSNDARYMRFYHLDELYRQGNEIGGMGKDHKNLTATYDSDPQADLAYKRDQVCGDFQALTDWGYHPQSFAYPASAENTTVHGIVRDCGFTTGRVAGGLSAAGPVYAEPVPPVNPMRLRALGTPSGPLTLQTLQNAVTSAGANGGGWLPIAFNNVCRSTDSDYSTCMSGNKPIDASVLESFLDWLATQETEGVSVRTVRQVMGSEQPELPQRPFVVSLTFDDALRSQYGLKDIFARHGVEGTFYINSGAVDAGEPGTMTWAQLREMQASGNDMGGHTRDHVNLLATDTSYEYKTRQVCDDRERILDEGLNAVSFAYPFGAMDATAQAFPRGCGYQSARKAGTVTSDGPIYSETIPVTENPYAIRILGTNYNGPVTLEALQYAVNQAIKYGGSWLPTLFHEICYVGTPGYDNCMQRYRPVDDATIDAFLSWLAGQADRNISVRTVADVMGGGSVAPRVSVTAPTAGATVNSARPDFAGTASGGQDVSVRLYQGDYTVNSPFTTLSATVSNGQWSVRPSADLPDGSYTVQASQPGGNTVGTSVPRRFVVSAVAAPTDTTAPSVSISSPTTGSSVTTPTPTVQGSAGTDAGDEGTVELRFHEGSSAGGATAATAVATVAGDGSWSTDAPALGDGVYTVVASQRDQAGNVGTSAPVSFTVDTTPVDITAPSVEVTSPTEGEIVTSATPTLRGTAGTDPGDTAQVHVAVSSASSTDPVQQLVADVTSSGTWSVPTQALADGTYVVQATQSDSAGNVGTSPGVTFSVSSGPVDTTAPTVTITSPANGATVSAADLTVAGTSGTDAGDRAAVDVAVWAGTAASGTAVREQTVTPASGAWSATVTGLAAGTYTVRASQSDAAGNVGRSEPVTVTKAEATTVTAVTPSSLGQGASGRTVTVQGTGFTSSSQVSVAGDGVTMSVSSWTSTTLTLLATVTGDATVGSRDVTVAGGGNGSVTCVRCFSVVAGPRITSVSPSTLRRGVKTTVTITGSSFRAGYMSLAVSGTGVSVGSVRVVSNGSMTAVLKPTANAALTARSLRVTDTGTQGTAVMDPAFTVVP